MVASNKSYPGRNGYIGSCRTPFKSVVKRMIGSSRSFLNGFRCNPLTSFDIRLSDPTNSDKIHKSGAGRIRFTYPTVSDQIRTDPVLRNDRNLPFHMTSDSKTKPLITAIGSFRILQEHRNSFDRVLLLSDNIHPPGTCRKYMSEIIVKLCTLFSIMIRFSEGNNIR